MGLLVRLFSNQADDRLKLTKSEFGDEWMVKKGYSILYVGTKEKCKTYMNQAKMGAVTV